MTLGVVGQKIGSTRIFSENGEAVSVAVILVKPNRITQIKTPETDGYNAIQVTTGQVKNSRVNKPQAGHFSKAGVEPGAGLWEFRIDKDFKNARNEIFAAGHEITVKLFENISHVDVVGISKGKGFAGTVKRHNFATQDATHGNSLSHRGHGSIGQRQSPGKVFKGKKMAGQMGNKRVTAQNLELAKIDHEKNLLLIAGGIPGAINGYVIIYPAVKKHKNNTNNVGANNEEAK